MTSSLSLAESTDIVSPQRSAVKALMSELRQIIQDPVEGCLVKLVDGNVFKWHVTMLGPPETLFEGAIFQLELNFPDNYPFSPPTVHFVRWKDVHHPNMYEDGEVCMSILFHPDDPRGASNYSPCECWSPGLTVRSVLISVNNLVNYPDLELFINYVAAIEYEKWKREEDKGYYLYARQVVQATRVCAEVDGLSIYGSLEDIRAAQQSGSFLKYTVHLEQDSDSDCDSSHDDDDGPQDTWHQQKQEGTSSMSSELSNEDVSTQSR